MLMCSSVALDNQSKTIPPIDSDQMVALLHAPANLHRANKKRANSLTVYPAATPQSNSIKLYQSRGRSFRKGGSSYRKILGDRDQSRSTPSATFTKPSKSGSGQETMTVTVPQESNKRKVQSNDGAPRNKCQRRSRKPKGDQKE